MRMNYITFRSVTPAQRGQKLLERAGFSCVLQRTPRHLQERGCSYCLRLRPKYTGAAAALLQENQVPYSKIYTDTGSIWEGSL